MATNPLLPGNSQPLVIPDNSGNSDNCSASMQSKCSPETEEDRDSDNEPTEIDADTFQLSETREAFLETAFKKRMDSAGRAKHIENLGVPDCCWTKCPTLDPIVSANLPKNTIRMDNREKQLQEYWLDAVTPLIVALENIQEDKADLQDATKAMQEALIFLGSASQHHSVHRRQAILQQLNSQLKPVVKDETLHRFYLENTFPLWQ